MRPIFTWRGRTARRIWEAEHTELNGRFVIADRERDAASRAVQDVADRLAAARRDEGNARGTRDRLTHELQELRRQVHAARMRWGDHVPDGPEYAEKNPSGSNAGRSRLRGLTRSLPRRGPNCSSRRSPCRGRSSWPRRVHSAGTLTP